MDGAAATLLGAAIGFAGAIAGGWVAQKVKEHQELKALYSWVASLLARLLDSERAQCTVTEQSLEKLKADGMPANVVEQLQSIKNQEITGKKQFIDMLKNTIGDEQTVQHKCLILKHAHLQRAQVAEELTTPTLHYAAAMAWARIPKHDEGLDEVLEVRSLLFRFLKGGDKLEMVETCPQFRQLWVKQHKGT